LAKPRRPVVLDIAEVHLRVEPNDVRDIIKEEVPVIVRAMIVEVVPGIVAVEIKPVREQLRQIDRSPWCVSS
jgi:hypothetical protein